MPTTSYAVLTKARAKYGKHLTEKDYTNLLACQSVPEVMVYLKSHTHFSKVLADVNERDVHRGRLEMLLRQDLFYEFDSLCRYDSNISEGFSRLVIERIEVEQIIRFLVLLNSNSTEKFIYQFPAYFIKHSVFDINKLANARNYEELLQALESSPYYEILKPFRRDDMGRLPVAQIEKKLYEYIYTNLAEILRKKSRGEEREELETIFKTLNDYKIFSQILRLKKYYNLPPEVIKSGLMTQFSGIKPSLIDKMCAAESSAEVFSIMQKTGEGRMIDKIGYVYAGDIYPRVKYRVSKKNIHFSNKPAVVLISFMFVAETELKNVITLIEGIRYKLDVKTIKSMLIY